MAVAPLKVEELPTAVHFGEFKFRGSIGCYSGEATKHGLAGVAYECVSVPEY